MIPDFLKNKAMPLALPGASAWYLPEYLSPADSRQLYEYLLTSAPWKQEEVFIFGKKHPQPRLTAWLGDPGISYTYSGLKWEPSPWLPPLDALRNQLQADFGQPFNSVLLNLYRSGADKMGAHADDERELGPDPVIASISLGATRRFLIRPKDKSAPSQGIDLADGSLLLMGSGVQQRYHHSLPGVARLVGSRINLTFRFVFG